MYLVAYQQFETVPIFSFVTYSSDRGSPLPSYLKLVLQPYVKSGSRKEKLRAFDCLLMIHDRSRTSTAPSYLRRAVGDISGKVWSTLISTQQGGIYPKSSLGFLLFSAQELL